MASVKRLSVAVRRGQTTTAVLALLAALLVLPLILAPRAEAFIYWTDNNRTIGRANLDGSGVNPKFITPPGGTLSDLGVHQGHIYWAGGRRSIGRANLDGTGVDPNFLDTGGYITARTSWSYPASLAITKDQIYWVQLAGGSAMYTYGTISRAALDGSEIERDLVPFPRPVRPHPPWPGAIAVDATHLFWGQYSPVSIGRANLDGTEANHDFISGSTGAIAVDAQHIYWTNGASIARANLDGSAVDGSFIADALGRDLALDAHHIYWTIGGKAGTIARADLDGTDVDRSFIAVGHPLGAIAVDGLSDSKVAGRANAPKTQTQTGESIVVRVEVRAKERLSAKVSGKIKVNPTYRLRPRKVELTRGETKTLKLKPKKAAAKMIATALKHDKKATARLEVKLTDQAGNTKTEKLRVRLTG